MSFMMSDSNMKWNNIKANRCPKDGTKLERKANGWECSHVDPYYKSPCGFFMTFEKRDALVAKMKGDPLPKK